MRIFAGKMFKRWAGSESISDEDLCATAKEAFAGNVEGDLEGSISLRRGSHVRGVASRVVIEPLLAFVKRSLIGFSLSTDFLKVVRRTSLGKRKMPCR